MWQELNFRRFKDVFLLRNISMRPISYKFNIKDKVMKEANFANAF